MKRSLVVTLLASVAVADGDDNNHQAGGNNNQCSLYLAPSVPGPSSGGNNMGVFAGVDYAPGAEVGYPDIVVPIVDVKAQIGTRKNRFGSEEHGLDWHWSDYVWEPRALGASGEGVDAKAAAPGLGSLVRGSSAVEPNVVPTRAKYDAAGLHRSQDPSAGSISYYHGMKTIATKPISAGAELFSDFGQHYFQGEELAAQGADPDAQNGDEKYRALVDGRGNNLEDEADSGKAGLWGMLWDNKGAFKRMMPQVTNGAVPQGGSAGNEGNHSTQWLHTHGYCLDNIVPAPSKIDAIGRGAVAARPIEAGAVIAPAPVVHLPDRDVLDIRAPRSDAGGKSSLDELMTDRVTGRQLVLNYCFGHSDSTLLLCPVGAVTSLINHAPRGLAEPNAEIRFSDSNMSNATWLNLTVDELDKERQIGLVLEYVALRDIQPGEEILIDYGREWEEAWREHVERWAPASEEARDYVDAGELNEMEKEEAVRTMEEQRADPYPGNVQTSCYYDYVPDAGTSLSDGSEGGGSSSVPSVSHHRWLYGMDDAGTNLRPCRILKRELSQSGEEVYTARLLNCDETHHDVHIPDDERVVVTDIPRRAVTFTNRLYTTDMHLKNVFRHEMMIPDEIFPEAWRNNL